MYLQINKKVCPKVISINQLIFIVLYSYPPKEIGAYDDALTISDVGIRIGDTVTLHELIESRESNQVMNKINNIPLTYFG